MKKRTVTIISILLLLIFVITVGWFRQQDVPETTETNSDTYCKTNTDCWCQVFTGAEFLPGRVEGSCNVEVNRCSACLYY